MTRGFVCVVNGKVVEDVAYLSSSAYLSYYGLEILTALQKSSNDFKKYMDEIHEINSHEYDDNPCENFKLNWIYPDKGAKECNNDYSEYGYIYNLKSAVLTVYNRGTRLVKPHTTKVACFQQQDI